MADNHAEIRQQIDEEITILEQRIRALRTQRNRSAPIHRLPVEIMARIFYFAYGGTDTRMPITLSAVSGAWRELTLDLPELWCQIDGKLKIRHIPAYLARSRQKPLHVALGDLNPTYSSKISEILRELLRIQELEISGALSDELVSGANANWKIKAPILKKLSIEYFSIRKSIFSGHVPLLSQLVLKDCQFDWNSLPALPQLKSLSVIRPEDRINMEDFLDRLPWMPLLDHIETVDSLTGTLTSPSQYQLPNLTFIQLESETCRLVAEMLRVLIIPRINRLILRLNEAGPQDQLVIIDALNQCTPLPTSPIRSLKVQERKPYCGYVIQGGSTFVVLQFHFQSSTADDIYQVLQRLNIERLRDLWLDFQNIEEVNLVLWNLFRGRVDLRELTVQNEAIASLAQFLASEGEKLEVLLTHVPHMVNTQSVSFSGLTQLVLNCTPSEYASDMETLVQYLHIRKECQQELESFIVASKYRLPPALKGELRNAVRQFSTGAHYVKTDLDDWF